MGTFFIAFALFALAIAGMAVGVLLGKRTLKGSCGGLGTIDGLDGPCEVCGSTRGCSAEDSESPAG